MAPPKKQMQAAAPDLLAAAMEALAVIPKIKPAGNGNGTEVRLRRAIGKALGVAL